MNCQYCNNPLPPGVSQCPACGAQAPVQAPPYGGQQPYGQPPYGGQQPYGQPPYGQMPPYPGVGKSRTAYVLLAVFLGELGIHNFYAGYTGKGVAQLLVSVLSCGYLAFIPWIWAIVEACTVTNDASGWRMS